MNRAFFQLVGIAVLPALAVACGGGRSDAAADDTSENELRALGANEIVGTIAYGQTKSGIAYEETPTYRALSFQATAGDEVLVDVRAASADARAWLLSSTFGTLASNDDASASTRDSHITHKLARTGTYYIAFREKNYEDASFSVTLARTNTPPPPPPPPPHTRTIPSSKAWCSGPEITHEQLLSRYAPASTTAVLSAIVMDAHQRECQDQTGCADWTLSSSVPFYEITWNSSSGYHFTTPHDVAVPSTGAATLFVNEPEIAITLDHVPGFVANLNLPSASAAGFQTELAGKPIQLGSWSSGSGSYLWFSDRAVTNTCLYASQTGRAYHGPGPGTYTEYEAVIFARY